MIIFNYFRPPPPSIQMYSMEEPEDPRGPIYDTIPYDNEDNAPPPPPSLPGGWGDKKPSTFSTRKIICLSLKKD